MRRSTQTDILFSTYSFYLHKGILSSTLQSLLSLDPYIYISAPVALLSVVK